MLNYRLLILLVAIGLVGFRPPLPMAERVPAALIEGEAGICGWEGKIAVAHVYQRNSNWNSNSRARPTRESIRAGIEWPYEKDYSNGAVYLWSLSDVQLPAVQAIIRQEGLRMVSYIKCRGGLALVGYN